MISLIHAASSQFQPSFDILGHICIYLDFNASIIIVVIVGVVVVVLLTVRTDL